MQRLPQAFLPALAFAMVLGVGRADAISIVYEHVPGGPGAWASEDTQDAGPVWRTFDQFRLGGTRVIEGITWRGAYVDLTGGVDDLIGDILLPDVTAFTFRFYGNTGGVPASAPMYELSLPFSSIVTSFVGDGSVAGLPAEFYDYGVLLPAGFMASGGVTYWLSISAVSPSYGPVGFAWAGGLGGDGTSYQLANLTTPTTHEGDRAFALLAVPEPATLILTAVGLCGAVKLRRRRR